MELQQNETLKFVNRFIVIHLVDFLVFYLLACLIGK